jgi:Domain of unknown function (DUF4394)
VFVLRSVAFGFAALWSLAASPRPAAAAEPAPSELLALTARGTLLAFHTDRPGESHAVDMPSCGGQLLGIDRRPADQRIYGLTDANDLVVLDLQQHRCSVVSTLTIPFAGGSRGGIDFTPQADRLRCLSADGQNLRVHPTLGATALDTALTYDPADPHAGERPQIVGAGYTRNVAGASTTVLYEIDATSDTLVIQDPPNDGLLKTVGPLGIDVGVHTGFEIVTRADGTDQAWLVSAGILYRVDLATGHGTRIGSLGGGETAVISITSAPPR